MFAYLSKLFNFFSGDNTSALDLYLKSKNVQSTAEIDYWVQQWERKNRVAYF